MYKYSLFLKRILDKNFDKVSVSYILPVIAIVNVYCNATLAKHSAKTPYVPGVHGPKPCRGRRPFGRGRVSTVYRGCIGGTACGLCQNPQKATTTLIELHISYQREDALGLPQYIPACHKQIQVKLQRRPVHNNPIQLYCIVCVLTVLAIEQNHNTLQFTIQSFS